MAMQLQKAVLDAGIVTRDLGRAARFYGEVLGLPAAGEIVMPGIGLVRGLAQRRQQRFLVDGVGLQPRV